jgi:hypothetical protein
MVLTYDKQHRNLLTDMTDLVKILKQLKSVPKYAQLSFDQIDKQLASKVLIRYRLLSAVYKQLNDMGLGDSHTPIDILAMKPIKLDGEVYALDGIVTAAFSAAALERESSYESVVDILKLHKLSKPIEFGRIADQTALEFLSRIPMHGETRTYREVKLDKDARAYFCSNRYLTLINLGVGEADEDQNYFITVIDLGSMFQNYFNGEESYLLFNPTIIARFEKVPFTGKPRHVNTKLMLWETVREPGRYYWFVRGENVKRTNHTFEILFGINQETRYSTLSNTVWSFYKRVFGLVVRPSTVPLRKSA